MSGLIVHGHLDWGLFAALVYTGLLWLVADVAWRCLTVRGLWLAAAFGLVWCLGLVCILAVS